MTTTALDRAHSKAQRLERELREARAALADAWDEGLSAGCDRWADAREFGDPPVNPYRAALDQDGDADA